MNVLQVNYTDTLGSRFNGGALIEWLRANGHHALHAVDYAADKQSVPLYPEWYQPVAAAVSRFTRRAETRLSLQSVLPIQSFLLPFTPSFRAADIVHYHIIHNNDFFSYMAFPWLSRLKPTVWSLHDPWALTGHCVHPLACDGWVRGCKSCPHLDYPLSIRRDRAWLNYKLKRLAYHRSNFNLVVASQWMKGLVERSPLLQQFPIHLIPFGLDLNVFSPGNKIEAKAKLGIANDRVVIGLRAMLGPYKGFDYAKAALEALPEDAPVLILTCQTYGLLSSLRRKFPVIDLGELSDDRMMADFFRACDIHLMPSVAESFGLMAMEAAACGVPSVVFSGTPLEEVGFAPNGSIAVEMRNVTQLRDALNALVLDPELRRSMGATARELAAQRYGFDQHAEQMLALYRSIARSGKVKAD